MSIALELTAAFMTYVKGMEGLRRRLTKLDDDMRDLAEEQGEHDKRLITLGAERDDAT